MITSDTSHKILDILGTFSTEQRQLLEVLLQKQGETLDQLPIPRRRANALIPLSYAQERIWTVAQFSSDSSVDNVPVALHLTGALDVHTLDRSLQQLVQRHEVLRTTCQITDRQPVQVVLPDAKPRLQVLDLQPLPATERLNHAISQSEQQARLPFNLSQDVLLRVTLFRLSESEFVLLLVAHQFATDGLSIRLLLQELAQLYRANLSQDYRSFSEPVIQEPVIQYGDFAIWQHQWFSEAQLTPQIAHWQQQLAGAAARIPWQSVADRAVATLKGAYEKVVFPAPLSDRLRQLCRQQGVTPFMAFVALLQILLYRYTQNPDISIGTLISNRNRREVETLIGNFSNNLLLRTVFTEGLQFDRLLAQVRENTLAAYNHQDMPFQRLTNFLPTVPQFQTLLLLRNTTTAENLDLPDITVQELPIELGVTRMELSLDLTDNGSQPIAGKLEYKTDLFTAQTIRQLMGNLEALANSVTQDIQQPISEIVLPETIVARFVTDPPANDPIDARSPLPSTRKPDRSTSSTLTAIEQRLAQIWSELLTIPDISRDDHFFELGGHSLLAVKLFAEIEQQFGKVLPLSTLLQAPRLGELAAIVQGDEAPVSWSPLVSIQAGNPEKTPLFCMHGGGFNVLIYRELAANLGADQPVYGLQARGLDGQIPIHLRLESMAADYLQEIRTIQPEGPYLLSGLSNGGNIALEIAQQLQAQGQSVALLAFFDSYGPSAVQLLPPVPRFASSLHYLGKFILPNYLQKLRSQPEKLSQDLRGIGRKLQTLSRGKNEGSAHAHAQQAFFIEVKHQQNVALFAAPEQLHAPNRLEQKLVPVSRYILSRSSWAFLTPSEQLEAMDDTMSSTLKDLEALYSKVQQDYSPKPYAGKITLFKANEFPPGHRVDRQLGWGNIAQAGVEVHAIPGSHTSIMGSKLLARKLGAAIAAATTP